MEFIDIPTEQTTAMTDLILALIALAAAGFLYRMPGERRLRTALWVWFFTLIAVASLLGAIAHGVKMSEGQNELIWMPLYLSLGLSMSTFCVAAIYDFYGETVARRYLPAMIATGSIFFFVTLIWPDNFMVFIAYEAVIMLFALAVYSWRAYRGDLAGAEMIVIGIMVTILAGVIQANGDISFKLIWEFDHNGVFHMVQMIGIGLLVLGLGKSRASIR